MAYTVLARKYRPQTFSDLVGQEHVTRTLGNAIASGRVAHAFLFTGVRGVGKTTTARILAKALNCAKGPTPEPCGVCDPCKEITNGVDLDVLEIDGASNNSVDDVRRLQETIPFRPARDRFKIVIVDEVHMLSAGAFNAFLKTLEEPPPHVKFIFATTESHKVPITIRSRCQRYDFRLIPQVVVAGRVREILAKEAIEADDAAVSIVAREAAGSMRDALTLLDQIVAFAGSKLEGAEVTRVLGIADRELLHGAATAVLDRDGAAVLAVVDALATRGLDMLHFGKALTELLRDLVVLRVSGPETELVPLVEEERRRAIELAQRAGELELQRAFASMSLLVDEIAKASMPRLVLEMGLVRLATRPPLRAIAEIVARLESIERRGPSGPGAPSPRGSGGGGPGRGPAPKGPPSAPEDAAAIIDKLRRTDGPEVSSVGMIASPDARVPASIAPASVAAAVASASASAVAHASAVASAPSAAPPSVPARAPSVLPPRPSASLAAPIALSPAAPAANTAPMHHAPSVAARTSSPSSPPMRAASPSSTAPATRAARAPEPASDPGVGPDGSAQWENLVAVLMETRPALGAVLLHATPARIGPSELVLAFPPGSFYARQADASDARAAIAEVALRILGARPSVSVVERDPSTARTATIAQLETERQRARYEATKKKALNHPMVVEALSVFEARPESAEVRLDGD